MPNANGKSLRQLSCAWSAKSPSSRLGPKSDRNKKSCEQTLVQITFWAGLTASLAFAANSFGDGAFGTDRTAGLDSLGFGVRPCGTPLRTCIAMRLISNSSVTPSHTAEFIG